MRSPYASPALDRRVEAIASARASDTDPTDPLAWQAAGLCRQVDPELFWPEQRGSADPARRVCSACPVRVECLTYAVVNDERQGVWGGMSETERDVYATDIRYLTGQSTEAAA